MTRPSSPKIISQPSDTPASLPVSPVFHTQLVPPRTLSPSTTASILTHDIPKSLSTQVSTTGLSQSNPSTPRFRSNFTFRHMTTTTATRSPIIQPEKPSNHGTTNGVGMLPPRYVVIHV